MISLVAQMSQTGQAGGRQEGQVGNRWEGWQAWPGRMGTKPVPQEEGRAGRMRGKENK